MTEKNIVWITIDSIRADHTTLGNHNRNTTPELGDIAASPNGTNFRKCIAQSHWTAPSSASMISGTYPSTHGVGIGETGQLPRGLPTLPELLSEQGYQTVGFSPNPYMSPATSLDRGFDEFVWFSPFRDKSLFINYFFPLAKYGIQVGTYGPGFTLDRKRHNFTYTLTEATKNWISSSGQNSDPFFLYLHLQNPHLPYTPPRKHQDTYEKASSLSVEEALELSLSTYRDGEHIYEQIATGLNFSDDEWSAIEAMYDSEIRYADDRVGDLFDFIQANTDDTIIIITSDHGDLFGEHGFIGHGFHLDDGLIRVPMVVHGLDGIEDNTENPVEHIDFTRTLAEVGGCSTDSLQGIDLRSESRDYCISQTSIDDLARITKYNSDFDVDRLFHGKCSAVWSEEFKYIEGKDDAALYLLPDEETDELSSHPDEASDMAGLIDTRAPWKGLESPSARFSDHTKERLHDLGYIE